MTDCRYCGDAYTATTTPGFCTRQCAQDAPAARERLAKLLSGKLPPPPIARTLGVDEIAVEIVANGIRHVPLNQAELDEVVVRMTRDGHPAREISRHTRLATRTVHRRRIRLGLNSKKLEGAS